MKKPTILPAISDYDWKEAFAYAGPEPDTCNNGSPDVRPTLPGSPVPLTHFTRIDVVKIIAQSEGEGDGPPWVIYGKLRDGRWFYLEAGCDYTGWDCQAGGSATVGKSRKEIERFGMTDEGRSRLGVPPIVTAGQTLKEGWAILKRNGELALTARNSYLILPTKAEAEKETNVNGETGERAVSVEIKVRS